MSDVDRLAERLAAVERALTGSDRPLADLEDAASTIDRLDDLAERIERLDAEVRSQEAAIQALRGYVGNVRAVNDDVEARADAALAKATALEADDAGSVETDSHPPTCDCDAIDSNGRTRAVRSADRERTSSPVERPDLSEFADRGDGWRDATAPAYSGADRTDAGADVEPAVDGSDAPPGGATAHGETCRDADDEAATFVTRLREAL